MKKDKEDNDIEQLISKLKYASQHERIQAAMQLELRAQDQDNERLVEPLIAALKETSYPVRHIIPSILEKIGNVRAIKPLIVLLHDPDFTIRASAQIALQKFGKAVTLDLIEELKQPDSVGHLTIIKLLGEIKDERALPALKEIVRNKEDQDHYSETVKDVAARAIRRIKPPRKKPPKKTDNLTPEESAEYDWRILLTDWSAALLDYDDLHNEPSPEAIKNHWLGYPGATEEQIRQAEERLGTRLPPSYRAFLKVTNGWPQITTFIYKMWSTEKIEWFRVRHEDWALIWVALDNELPEVPDEEYFVYDENQTEQLRGKHMLTALEISDVGDSCIFLLNPQVVTPEGEWEAWFFANWIPGARRYRSFWDMMQDEYKNFLRLQDV